MTTSTIPEAEADIPRDQWGRPKIIPPGGGKPEAYTRASTGAKAIDDLNGLIGWAGRQVLRGLVARPDIYEFARTVGDNDSEIRQLADRAKEAAGSTVAASVGTTLHWWADQLDRGTSTLDDVPVGHKPLLAEYVNVTEKLEVIESELFVVCDELRFAGSLDRLVKLPDGDIVVADIKTGKWAPSYGSLSAAVQCAIYAHGKRYNRETGERTDLHPEINMNRSVLIHLPVDDVDNVALYELDGELGYYGAELSRRVINMRKARPVKAMIL